MINRNIRRGNRTQQRTRMVRDTGGLPPTQPCFDMCDDLIDQAFDCYGIHEFPLGGPNCNCTPVQFGSSYQPVEVDTDGDGENDSIDFQLIPNMMYQCNYSGPSYASCYASCYYGSGGGRRGIDFGGGRASGTGRYFRTGGPITRRSGAPNSCIDGRGNSIPCDDGASTMSIGGYCSSSRDCPGRYNRCMSNGRCSGNSRRGGRRGARGGRSGGGARF